MKSKLIWWVLCSVINLEPEELDELPGLLIEPPKKDITLIHVTTLDEVVSVSHSHKKKFKKKSETFSCKS